MKNSLDENYVGSPASEFYDAFLGKLIADFLLGNKRMELALKYTLSQLSKNLASDVLDLGCGIGWSSTEISRLQHGPRVTGVDLSKQLITAARTMFGETPQRKYLNVNLESQDWRDSLDEKFDACILIDVYEHINKDARPKFHESLSKILTNDAIIVLTCPSHLHQNYLRRENPQGLQPVDEDVLVGDLLQFANAIGGELSHFSYVDIWSTNDYFHATLSRGLKRETAKGGRKARGPKLLPVKTRIDLVRKFAEDNEINVSPAMEEARRRAAPRPIRALKRIFGR